MKKKLLLNRLQSHHIQQYTTKQERKKSRLKLSDFLKFSATTGIEENVTMQLIASMKNALPTWAELINNSFLSKDMKEAYLELIEKRIKALSND